MSEPVVIQGGMGTGVSNWRLAQAVARTGQMGVVSGTALDNVMIRRLQDGDLDGDILRALRHFPDSGMAQRVLDRYYITGGRKEGVPYKTAPMYSLTPAKDLLELTVTANFVEVFLAKEGHNGPVGVNFLEKIKMPALPSIYGAILAGVDYVLMGAGIPRAIPAILDKLSSHEAVSLKINVEGASAEDDFRITFNPRELMKGRFAPLKRPKFLAIVSSSVLAATLAKKSTGRVDGFVVEGPTAGGHNAPPRGPLQLSAKGEPVYGPRDEVDPAEMKKLGLPFWLAGSYAAPEKLQQALGVGAAGVQVGTVFAYCEESGLTEKIKEWVIRKVLGGKIEVFTDPVASPTGFPFKIVQLEGTCSDPAEYAARSRICDLGYLRTVFKRKDGTVGYRCPGEPVETYLQKEGNEEDTKGRKCLCNGLMANVGIGQSQRSGYQERPLVTSGDDIARIGQFISQAKLSYSAAEVVSYLLGKLIPVSPVISGGSI
ncbi:MAG TPA: nitronate monooxygenase [bacterium]|nr:nitronate monooxygenase [bacterium]